jgi:hypothetical protein
MEPVKDIDIGRNIRTIEWLKVEIIGGVADLFRQLPKGREELVTAALGNLIMCCYLLGKRLGISYSKMEAAVERKARLNVEENHEIEAWYKDLSTLLQHLEARRHK